MKPALIFDLDQTLIDSKKRFLQNKFVTPISNKNIKILILDNYIVHLRPYTMEILEYCYYNNIDVGFWSSGSIDYVKQITNGILETLLFFEDIKLKPRMIWARTKTLRIGPYFDVINNKYIRWSGNVYNTNAYKDMNYLFENTTLSKNNTILVDNLPLHLYQNNPNNILIIPPFCYLNKNDDILNTLLNQLEKLNKKSLKLLKSSMFNMNYLSPDNKFIYPTGYIQKCINKTTVKSKKKSVVKSKKKSVVKSKKKSVVKSKKKSIVKSKKKSVVKSNTLAIPISKRVKSKRK